MHLEELTATTHPDGNRIDLHWANPNPVLYPGVRVVRHWSHFPADPDDGDLVVEGVNLAYDTDAQGRALHTHADIGLQGETVYYYGLFPYNGSPPVFQIDASNRAAALAGASHDSAGKMYALLPAIYRRYDQAGAVPGLLRRFLELPGGQLDLFYSHARALLDACNLDRVDGRLLPLLAQWIGWNTDFRLGFDAQRNEIRNAPSVYKRIGLIHVVGATVKRITGWESRSKEFVHNVFRTNNPPHLYLRARQLDAAGQTMTDSSSNPLDRFLSIDEAYEGRPASLHDDTGIRWLFYHTDRRGRWRIWYKTSPTYQLDPDLASELVDGSTASAPLQQAFTSLGLPLDATAAIAASGSLWSINDVVNGETYVLQSTPDTLTVYHTSADPFTMAPSRPLLDSEDNIHEKDPTAALQGATMWLFWAEYDIEANRWAIRFRTRTDGVWSSTFLFTQGTEDPNDITTLPERRMPAACVDRNGGLWLFWLEYDGSRWQLRYNRHDGTGLPADPTSGWQLDPPAIFPDDGGTDPRVEDGVFVLSNDGALTQSLWLFWARREPLADPAQTRWTVAYRIKADIDPNNTGDWGSVELITRTDLDAQDREPSAVVGAAGDVLAFWSASRGGSWSIWQSVLDPGTATPWGTPVEVTTPPYRQRNPFPLPLDTGFLLLYRSSESLRYTSDAYRATETVDFRYAGATTVDVRNTDQISLRGDFEDFQTYTYDAGTADDDWYRRDTLGIYLTPDTTDANEITQSSTRLSKVLPEFMPATDRAVLIPEP